MNKTKLILWILVMLCLAGFANAAAGDVLGYWNFDGNTTGQPPNSSYNGNFGTESHCPKAAQEVRQEGTDYYVAWLSGNCHFITETTATTGTYCVELEWNQTFPGVAGDNIFDLGDQDSASPIELYGQGYNSPFHFWNDSENEITGSTPGIGWHNVSICVDLDVDVAHMWIDTVRQTDSGWTAKVPGEDFDNILLGNPETDNNSVRQLCAWVGNYSDRPSTCDNGAGGGASGDTINMTDTLLPVNQSPFNQNTISFNKSDINVTADAGNFTCDLLLNGTVNSTQNYTAPVTNQSINFSLIMAEGHYVAMINCHDNGSSKNTTNNTLYVDLTSPTGTTNFSVNNLWFRRNISGQFNFTDVDNIHTVNITIDGEIIVFNITNIDNQNYTYNLQYNATNLSSGNHTLGVYYSDGHTSKELREEYDWSNGIFNDYMKYKFSEGGFIETYIKNPSLSDSWTTEKKTDRYIQILEPANPSDTIVLIEESDKPIHITNRPGRYKGQWIIVGEHWKDYVLKDEPNTEVSIARINDYSVEVTISGIKNTDRLEFESIGDLNVVWTNYTFFTTNATLSYNDLVSELSTQTLTLQIDKHSGINFTNATFKWNTTTYSVIKASFPTYDLYTTNLTVPTIAEDIYNITFNWFYNITAIANNESGNISNNVTITKILIDNCSTYTTRAINFSMRWEGNNSLANGTMDGYFTAFVDAGSLKDFNLTWGSGAAEYGLCITPDNAVYNATTQIEYVADRTTARTYYLTNATLDNETNVIDLYVRNGTTIVKFAVTDQDDNDVQGAFIYVLRYDFGTNSHVVSEILRTDESGEALGNIVLDTQWYKFVIVYNGIARLETDPLKITTTSRNFRINLIANSLENYNKINEVLTSLTFTNSTKNFAYTFVDPTGNSRTVCLKVIRRTINGDSLVNESCMTAASGTILMNIGTDLSVGDDLFIATGTVNINPDFLTDVLSISFDQGYKKWGQDGIFVTFFLRMTMAFVGVWNPVIAILMLIVTDFLMMIFGLYHMGWDTLLVYIVLAGLSIWRLNRKD